MRRDDFERKARLFWGEALRLSSVGRGLSAVDLEELVSATTGLVYGKRLLDQGLPAATGTRR